MKQVRFPKISRFDEIFSDYRIGYEIGKRHWPVIELRPGLIETFGIKATIGEYCLVNTSNTFLYPMHVRPTSEIIRSIRDDCVVPDAGPLYFRIIGRDKTALVCWHYNSIIGDRWLAVIDPKTIPEGVLV